MARVWLPITVDSEILSGTPVFRGTRVPIQTLLDYILDGQTLETFLLRILAYVHPRPSAANAILATEACPRSSSSTRS